MNTKEAKSSCVSLMKKMKKLLPNTTILLCAAATHAVLLDGGVRASMLERAPQLAKTIRRAEFWDRNQAQLLDVVNVMGRWDAAAQWRERTEFTTVDNPRATSDDQGATEARYEMAKKLGMCERVALVQNVQKLPFTNTKLAASLGVTVEDFAELTVEPAACNIVYDALAQSKAGLIPPDVIDVRRNNYISDDGSFNELAFSLGLYKARSLVIVSWFLFGKGNVLGILVLLKVILDATGNSEDIFQRILMNQELILVALATAGAMSYVGAEQDTPKTAEDKA